MRIRYIYTIRTMVSSIKHQFKCAGYHVLVTSGMLGIICIVNGLCSIEHQYTDIDDTNPSASAHFLLSAAVSSDYV
jgi:hypothetical protein